MSSAFLSKEDLKVLTGYGRSREQKAWLIERGWVFLVNSDGDPVVGRAYCDAKMAGQMLSNSVVQGKTAPNFNLVN